MKRITSPSNPLIKDLRKLARKKARQESGLCLVEGIQPVLRAMEVSHLVDTIIVCPELLSSHLAHERVAEAHRTGTRVVSVSPQVFSSLSERDNPIGLAAVARPRLTRLDDLPWGEYGVFVALHRVGSPGNLGTTVRTSEALGAGGVVLLDQTADPFDPEAVRASVGTVFTVPLARAPSSEAFLATVRSLGIQVVTSSARAALDVSRASFSFPLVLILGSEAQGLPPELLNEGDLQVSIPTSGQISSLNLSVAAGVLLYELQRARRRE